MVIHSVFVENTISAIRKAAESGFEYIEMDASQTVDNIFVIMHD